MFQGLVKSLKQLVLDVGVRFCVRHLYANFRNMWRGQRLKNLLWRAAIAYQKNEYTIAIDLL